MHYPKRISKVKRARKLGFRARMKTRNGRKMINAKRRVGRRGLGFAVVCPPGPLHRVFEVTDMVSILGVCPDRESAIAAVARPRARFT